MLSETGRVAREPACAVEAPVHSQSIVTAPRSFHLFLRNL